MLTIKSAQAVALLSLCTLGGLASAQDDNKHLNYVTTPPYEIGSEGSESMLKAEWLYQQQAGSVRYYGQVYTHPDSDIAQCQQTEGGCNFIYVPTQ